ncbi:hypothetical protein Pmani_014936 [Petrolisthes manimaculis]|uniref:Uncharacterized protein n=1 Tax=Petrolisthes manimaculis TaxID=1843537 RepID=A0AAE1U860_9EUCA|nr:hypothetical protein Pmani_014936 [Petrolisthes manimaculis]
MALHKGRFLWYENLKPRSYIEETSCCGTQGQTTQEILYVFYSEWDRPVNMSRAYLDGTNVMVFSSVLLVPDGTTGKLKAQCGCPVGKKLASDEKTCVVDPDAEPVDPSCAPWDFTCANGRCIQKTWSLVER